MSEWLMVKLGEVCRISIGKTPARKEPRYWGDGLPWLSIKDMNQGPLLNTTSETITNTALSELNISPYPAGTVLFSFKLSIGKVGITTKPMFTNEAIAAIEPHNINSLDKPYLAEALRFIGQSLEGNAAVMGITLNKKSLAEINIPLPPLGEQKRIAEMLSGVNKLIISTNSQREIVDQLERRIFQEFRNQNSKSSHRVGDKCQVHTGATPSRNNPAYYNGIIPWIKTGEVQGTIIDNAEEYITETAIQETNCRKFPAGTTLVAMYGQGSTRGRAGILNCEAATNQACAAIIPHQPEDEYYTFAALHNSYNKLRSLGRGGTQPNLNLKLIKNFKIPWPEKSVREDFMQRWRELNTLRSLLIQRIALLQELQRSLSTRAFAGLL